jgi:glycosyltransferase involved in cell wall biosynthesis
MNMKSLVVTPRPTDALSFYRCVGPLRRLKEQYPFSFSVQAQINWSVLAEYDNLFLHRPYQTEHAQIADIAKKWGYKIWCDFDDWLLDLEKDNPAKKVFDESKEHVLRCKRSADLIFTATNHLKTLCESVGAKRVVHVPNAYDNELFPYAQTKKERLKICMWRGSNSHNLDIKSILPGLEKTIKTFPDWQFVFLGYDPSWMFLNQYNNVHYVAGKHPLEYMHMIWDMAPSVVYHPLHDSDFNRSKSMCSWLEATHAGAAFVGPDFEEFNQPGITNYKPGNSDSFFESMKLMLQSPVRIQENFNRSSEFISSKLLLKQVNEIRWKALSCL